jgi:hypothetical protein
MKISEDSANIYYELPRWVDFFINQGFGWEREKTNKGRKIRIISMPCNSHAAALIALGAVMKDLTFSGANDRERHLDSLFKYADQYLNYCRTCKYDPCNPELKGCPFKSRASGKIRLKSRQVNHRIISEKTDFKNKILVYQEKTVTGYINLESSKLFDHYPDGGIPLSEGLKSTSLDLTDYRQIHTGLVPIDDNCSTSYSGLCLAGQPRLGSAESKRFYSNFIFNSSSNVKSLVDLLPINGWSKNKVSRLVFFNTRGEQKFSHEPNNPYLVIVDGLESFFNSIDNRLFKNSDFVVVLRRDMTKDIYDQLDAKLQSMLQWFERSESEIEAPKGIIITDFNQIIS